MQIFTRSVATAIAVVVFSFAASAQCACDLIFSQYAEGSDNHKFVEVYNGTGADVDLSDYELRWYFNGSTSYNSNVQCMSGTLAHGEAVVIGNGNCSVACIAGASPSTAANHNGNDAIALYKRSSASNIDVIGEIGNSSNFGQDVTLVRNADVTCGDPDGDITVSEWTSIGFQSQDGWGSHDYDGACDAPEAGFAVTYCAGDLFISEYVEGSGFNKCIEIYNGTGDDVDLSCYAYQAYTNGSSTVSTSVALGGTLASGDVYVLCNTSASYGDADQYSGSVSFNGDDAVTLANTCTGDIVDIIGVIGEDPGSDWDGLFNLSTANTTIRRNADVLAGVTTSPSTPAGGTDDCSFSTIGDWTAYGQDDLSGLGAHSTVDCGYSCGNPNGGEKVEICHKGKTICVSVNAVEAHFANHGDSYACGGNKTDFQAEAVAINNVNAFPNPFENTVTLNFNVSESATLNIYSVTGQVVYSQLNIAAGQHSIQWNAEGLSSGMYIARIQTSNETSNMKLMLAK